MSWRKPLAKFRSRVNMWQDQAIGLHWQARVYNTFIIPTLLFIAQLEKPDDHIVKATELALTQIGKGPTSWASSQDLYQLKEAYGQTSSFNNIEWMATASKARVLHADKGIPSMELFLRDVNRFRTA